jgi:hypothetical protein
MLKVVKFLLTLEKRRLNLLSQNTIEYCCRFEVVNPSKEKNDNENIKKKSPKEVVRHDDSKSTSKVKKIAFRTTHGNPKIIIMIKQFGTLRVKKNRFVVQEEYQVERRATILSPTHQMDDETGSS